LFQALKLAAVAVTTLLCLSTVVLAAFVAKPDFTQGDAERGKQVYQRLGVCVNCHGWPGDGQSKPSWMRRVSMT
jgi:cytochrome c553